MLVAGVGLLIVVAVQPGRLPSGGSGLLIASCQLIQGATRAGGRRVKLGWLVSLLLLCAVELLWQIAWLRQGSPFKGLAGASSLL
jgi:hypothetical protein